MDLDQFKNIINRQPETHTQQDITDADMIRMLSEKAKNSIAKIKKNIWFEMVTGFLFMLFAIYWLVKHQTFFIAFFAITIIVICLIFLTGFYYLNKKISRYNIADNNVKQSLEQVITIIENFIRLYFQLTVILVPAILALSLVLNIAPLFENQKNIFQILKSNAVLKYLGISLIWSVIMYFFSKWYINHLYRKHLEKLKEQLKELKNQ